MLERLKFLIGRADATRDPTAPGADADPPGPDEVAVDGVPPLRIADHLTVHYGLPIADWPPVEDWVAAIATPELQARAWTECERAWLLHLRKALGPDYRLVESENAMVLSSLEPNVARATLDYMERTLRRVTHVLDGVAHVPEWGKDLLIVFDEQDAYYHYVSYYYPESGEFAFSSGMHIGGGCSHFVTVKADLRSIEPVIAHEMTHGCVAHLPLPLWLNEGLAVNTERRLAGAGIPLYTPAEMHDRHLAFWGEEEIQQFWSGASFGRTDEGNSLSYDLARIMVEQMAKDWAPFARFVLAADRADAGASAAHEHLGMALETYACALLGCDPSAAWAPDPEAWQTEPERDGA
jgi:hypothetical protein